MDINTEILNQLETIWIALFVIGALLLGVLIFHISFWSYLYKDMVKKVDGKTFERVATNMFDEGRLEDLEKLSRDKLKTHPNNVHAHYYLGKAQYKNSQYEQAKMSFKTALDCEPHWEETIVPYLKKIDEKVNDS